MASGTLIKPFYGIDTANVLVNNIATSWTATQDCWLVVTLYVGTTNVRGDVEIDGVTVGTLYYYKGQADTFLLARSEVYPIKAGQTIERQNATGDISALPFTVYGIK